MWRPVSAAVRRERVTILGWEGCVVKVLQADQAKERLRVRHLQVREVPEGDPVAAANALGEMVAALDRPMGRCLLVVPRSDVLVRYAKLPSRDPAELSNLATYQLHGELPFPVEECCVAVQPLAVDEDGTRAFLAVVHRPLVERLLTLAKSAGLVPEAIAVSTEGVALWAGRLWKPLGLTPPRGWAFAAVAGETVELGVVEQGTLVFMRRSTLPELTPDQLALLVQETVTAYRREPRGIAPEAALAIGTFAEPAAWETALRERLGWPVSVVDPASSQLWEEPLTTVSLELLHELGLVDLLGVATRPRQIALDLLPVDIKQERLQRELQRAWRGIGIWVGVGLGVVALTSALGVLHEWRRVRQLEVRVAQLEPQARRVQAQVALVEQGLAARRRTEQLLHLLTRAAAQMPAGLTWSTATLEAQGRFTIKGAARDYNGLFSTLAALSQVPGVWQAALQSAIERQAGQVEFELLIQGDIS